MKRVFWIALAAGYVLVVAGCSSDATNPVWSEYFQVLKQSAIGAFGSHGITLEQAATVPYASLGYRINGGPETLLVLATDTSGEELWTSSAHIVIVTQGGRVKRTVGLPHDLGQLTPTRGISLPPPASALIGPSTNIFSVDFPDTGNYSISLTCRMIATGKETIKILDRPIPTTRVDETCASTQIGWRFKNSYWLDSDRFVWRSLQHTHPKADTLQIEVFRPPG